MKKRSKHLLNNSAKPRREKPLLIFLPFLTLVLVALILAPGILSIMEDAPLLPPESAATAEPAEAEGLARLPEEEAVQLPTPEPVPVPTPEPITVSESGSLLGWQQIAGSTYYYDQEGTPVTGMQTINGKLYFFDQYGVKAERLGIDVSFYNKFITWPAVAAQGINFAILRAGGRGWETGLIYDDRWFQRNLKEARAAGIDLGVYFFSTAT
ncbi:MAG: GH25 family lysozyme, partial [Candidatus Limivicinus sp.]